MMRLGVGGKSKSGKPSLEPLLSSGPGWVAFNQSGPVIDKAVKVRRSVRPVFETDAYVVVVAKKAFGHCAPKNFRASPREGGHGRIEGDIHGIGRRISQ